MRWHPRQEAGGAAGRKKAAPAPFHTATARATMAPTPKHAPSTAVARALRAAARLSRSLALLVVLGAVAATLAWLVRDATGERAADADVFDEVIRHVTSLERAAV